MAGVVVVLTQYVDPILTGIVPLMETPGELLAVGALPVPLELITVRLAFAVAAVNMAVDGKLPPMGVELIEPPMMVPAARRNDMSVDWSLSSST